MAGVLDDGVGLRDGGAVDEELAAVHVDPVAGESRDAFYDVVSRIEREVEDDDVAAVDGLIWQQGRPVAGGSVDGFVDEEEVSDEQGALHGFRWNAEGLHDEAEHEESDDDDAEERAECLPQAGVDDVVMGMVRSGGDEGRPGLGRLDVTSLLLPL